MWTADVDGLIAERNGRTMTTATYISTIKADHTVELPDSMPVGAQVAVTLLPTRESQEENVARNLRFQKVMEAIRAAINSNYTTPEISDQELNQLIREARQAAKA